MNQNQYQRDAKIFLEIQSHPTHFHIQHQDNFMKKFH